MTRWQRSHITRSPPPDPQTHTARREHAARGQQSRPRGNAAGRRAGPRAPTFASSLRAAPRRSAGIYCGGGGGGEMLSAALLIQARFSVVTQEQFAFEDESELPPLLPYTPPPASRWSKQPPAPYGRADACLWQPCRRLPPAPPRRWAQFPQPQLCFRITEGFRANFYQWIQKKTQKTKTERAVLRVGHEAVTTAPEEGNLGAVGSVGTH